VATTAPAAPTNVTATSGDGSATISWTAPTDNGGVSIDGYIVTANPGGLTCTAVAPATTCTISGLDNGTTYTFDVVATNNVGNSSSSDPSGSVTPASGPAAPDRVQVTPGNGSATINWSAPTSGPTPTSYTVTVNPDGHTCTVDLTIHPLAPLSCTFTGLDNGVVYTFTVTATTGSGATASDTVVALVQAAPTKPSTPRGITFRGTTKGVATLTWLVSGSNGGSSITRYIARVTGPHFAKTCSVNVAANANAALTCSVSGLKPRTNYTYTVIAVNSVGSNKPRLARRAIDTNIRIATFARGKTTMWSGLYRQAYITAFYIKKFKFTKVTITGYSNFGGSRATTLAYTQARALTVANYLNRVLASMHVSGVTVTAVGNGSRLVGRNSKLNRSVSALLSYK
jgi:outer membrane protein OmpA-like peptidoglycan-associated protein